MNELTPRADEKCVWCKKSGGNLEYIELPRIETKFSTIQETKVPVHLEHKTRLLDYYKRLENLYSITNIFLVLVVVFLVIQGVFSLINHPLESEMVFLTTLFLGLGFVSLPIAVPRKQNIFTMPFFKALFKGLGIALIGLSIYTLF